MQGAPPNTRVCPVCLGMPGMLPVINRAAVEATIKTGLALQLQDRRNRGLCRARTTPIPTCPKAIRSASSNCPCASMAHLDIELHDGSAQTHPHPPRPSGRRHRAFGPRRHAISLVDLNRAGVPLMEIVTEADIHSADEAYAFLTKLRTILRYLGVNSGDMEKGALRCEPNISVRTLTNKRRAANMAPRSKSRTSTASARCAAPLPMNCSARSN